MELVHTSSGSLLPRQRPSVPNVHPVVQNAQRPAGSAAQSASSSSPDQEYSYW